MKHRPDLVPTRSVLRELEAEQIVVREGRRFLDQKRMLLAVEILARLARYRQRRAEVSELERRATSALARAIARHGLDGLLSQPVSGPGGAELVTQEQLFLGIRLMDARLDLPGEAGLPPASNPSVEARACRALYVELVESYAGLAAEESSLRRLKREYRRTERRTRALEDVLEPELSQTVDHVRDVLEEQDLEEAMRARLRAGSRRG